MYRSSPLGRCSSQSMQDHWQSTCSFTPVHPSSMGRKLPRLQLHWPSSKQRNSNNLNINLRPSHCPAFDGGGRPAWSILSCDINVSTQVDGGQEGELTERMQFVRVLRPKYQVVSFHCVSIWDWTDTTREDFKIIRNLPSFCLRTQVNINVVHMLKWSRSSLSVLAHCTQASDETGWWEGLGMRLYNRIENK